MNPLDYSLCQQTVTVYQKKGEEISRHVAEKSYFSGSVSTPTEPYGKSKEKKFLLMIILQILQKVMMQLMKMNLMIYLIWVVVLMIKL